MIFDDEQEQFSEVLRSFARDRLKAEYARWEAEPVTPEFIADIAALGATGLLIPEEYGGSAAGYVAAGIASEEWSLSPSIGGAAMSTIVVGWTI